MRSPTVFPDDEPLSLPARPSQARGAPFPLVASIAPLAASVVIWAITQSPFALIFAALSPIVAIAGLADAGTQRRKSRKRDAADRARALADLREQLRERHDRERRERIMHHPPAAAILGEENDGSLRWKGEVHGGSVALGSGSVPSGLRLRGEAVTEEEAELRATAGVLDGAVIDADATKGLGLVGPLLLTRAVARGYLVQLADGIPPGRMRIARLPDEGWDWAVDLPHFGASSHYEADMSMLTVVVTESADSATRSDPNVELPSPRVIIALAEKVEQLPMDCRTVVRVEAPSVARILTPLTSGEGALHGDGSAAVIRPELVADEAAHSFAARLTEHAHAVGLLRDRQRLPARVFFDELPQRPSAGRLSATIGIAEDGPLTLDLVEQGPHALVGGTTGSGKSELLITWVTALAANYEPEEVTFLLVDFKGGSAFASLTRLPHCVGVITDLAHGEADRALSSLAAEIRFRERTLADRGARDIAELSGSDDRGMPRLVIVVDEFAAMLEAFPALHGLFADLAARGRSLGIHVVLCTQRPAGVVRDALLANCALRLSLRVHNAADSSAVVGTAAAAELSAADPGRCVISTDGRRLLAQIAVTTPEVVGSVADRTVSLQPPRRPWLDPLPARVPLSGLEAAEGDEIILGLEDRPDQQRQSAARYRFADGHLLVLGARGTGKSGLLAVAGARWRGPCVRIPADLEGAWDALVELASYCVRRFTDVQRRLILVDDLDSLIARFPDEYQAVALERLTTILRDGPAAGLWLIVTAQRITPPLRSASVLFAETLLLGLPTKQEHVLAGGPPELFEPRARAGLAAWRGHRVQLAVDDADSFALGSGGRRSTVPGPSGELRVLRLAPGSVTVLVCRSAARRMQELRRDGGIDVIDAAELGQGAAVDPHGHDRPLIVIGDPDLWQARWAVLATLRSRFDAVIEGCSVQELRAVLRSRELPPLLGAGSGHNWLARPDGTVHRAVWE